MKKTFIVLFGIMILAAILRLWQIGDVPPSPDWDEAALGYNAYSILETGRDEYGQAFPMVLKSFGDYKPALYTYFIIPLIPIFDLSITAVRLPSAIAGIIAVFATYLFVKELISLHSKSQISNNKQVNNKNSKQLLESENWKVVLPLLSAGLLAISPWHIQFSRVAFESNMGLTFNILMATCFVIGLRKNWLFIFSGLFAALSIYTYQSEKIFTPLLVLVLAVIYRKELLSLPKRYLTAACVVGFLAALPMIMFTLTSEHGLARAKGTSVFASQDDILKYSIQKLERDRQDNNIVGMVFDNRRIEYAKLILSGYLSHYDLNWLFIEGDGERHHAPFMGLMYLWELPFLLIGIYTFIFASWIRKYRKLMLVVFAWFLIAPIPAAITNDVPHAVRTLNFLPTLQIFTAAGLIISYMYIRQYRVLRVILYTLFIILSTGNIMYFLNQYFVQQNYFYSQAWQYGYAQAVEYAQEQYDHYDTIVVSDRVPLDQSYIFFLYYLKFPPQEYQETQGDNHSFAKFEFRPIEWSDDSTKENTLFIGSPGEFPLTVKSDKTINYLNGEEAIKIVSTD